eukprot:346805-Rhodomonas_salina.1
MDSEGAASRSRRGTARARRQRGGEGPRRCGVEKEERRKRTTRVLRRGGGEGPRGCSVEGEEKDREGAASRSRRGTARVR